VTGGNLRTDLGNNGTEAAPDQIADHGGPEALGGDKPELKCGTRRFSQNAEDEELAGLRPPSFPDPAEIRASGQSLGTGEAHHRGGEDAGPGSVLVAVTTIGDLDSLGHKALATLLPTAAQQVPALFGSHAGPETELTPAAALRRLIRPFAHILLFWLAISEAVTPVLGEKGPGRYRTGRSCQPRFL
jgi:hypothetical protein